MTIRGVRPLPRSAALLLVLVLAVGLLGAVPRAAFATTSAEQAFVDHVNRSRAAKGLAALQVNAQLAGVARGWSGAMASSGKLSHRPGLGSEVSKSVTEHWERVGENVGYTTNASGQSEKAVVERLHQAFLDSTGHRANILGAYNQVGVGVVVAGNGTMWVTVNFMQGPLAERQIEPKMAVPSFGSWQSQPAAASSPAVVSWGDGRTDLFALNGQGRLIHRWDVNGTWGPGSTWQDMGAPPGVKLVGQPAAASQRPGSLDVVVRGDDDAVWHIAWRGSGWSKWTSRGGRITHSPAAVSWGPGHLAFFAAAPNGTVYLGGYYDGRWQPWRSVGGIVTSAPAVASWQTGRYDVFARGRDGALWHRWHVDGRWGSWEKRGGALLGAGRPEAVAWSKGRLDVFVVGTNAQLYRTAYQAGFGWQNGFSGLGGPTGGLASGTSAVSWQAGHLEVFARGNDGRTWRRETP